MKRSAILCSVAAFLLGAVSFDPASPDWTAEGNAYNFRLGASASSAGDVNGDGHDDVILGGTHYVDGQTGEGRALVFHGGPLGLGSVHSWAIDGNQAYANLGQSVAGAGDVNGDGFDDVVVGSPGRNAVDPGGIGTGSILAAGAVYVAYGGASGIAGLPLVIAGGQANANLGGSVAAAGDVDADGYDDVLVGEPNHDGLQADSGRLHLHRGGPAGLSTVPAWTLPGTGQYERMGQSMRGGADLNGDGVSDVVVASAGRILVYYGVPVTGLKSAPDWIRTPVSANSFGLNVGTGDFNGDGIDDLVAGLPQSKAGGMTVGAAEVYLGSLLGPASTPAWSAAGAQENQGFGTTVAGAGDVDGDGFDEIIIGSVSYDNPSTPGEYTHGVIYVFRGGAGGP